MPDASSAIGDDNRGHQIRISFVLDPSVESETPEGDTIEVPSDPIAVPATVRRRGLSAIINHLLDRKVEPEKGGSDSDEGLRDGDSDEEDKLPSINFDFIVNGRLLRTGLEAAARREGLSFETAIKIKYFPGARAPKSQGESEEMPDWITAMSVSGDDRLVTGCADGSIRALSCFDKGVVEICTVKAHTAPVKCVSSLSMENGGLLLASGSIDQTLLTHVQSKKKSEFVLHAVYSGGHSSSVCSLSLLNQTGPNAVLASGDWDGGLSIWKVPSVDAASEGGAGGWASKKKQRTEDASSSAISSEIDEVQPAASWKAHSSNISGIVYTNGSNGRNIITGSWDHSLKVWDTERQDCILTLNGSRVVTALGRCHNSDVVATGHPDCTIRLWDMRVDSKTESSLVTDSTLKPSHKAWVSAVNWSPTDPYILASTSHDGTVKVWDIRSPLPLHTVRAHEKGEKGLCLAYGKGVIYSGGSDCVVKRFVQ